MQTPAIPHLPPRFASRLLLWVASIFVAGIGALIAIWYFGLPIDGAEGARQQRIHEAGRLLQLGSDKHIERITALLREKRGDVMVLAEHAALLEALKRPGPAAQHALLKQYHRLQRAYPDAYQALLILDAQGRALAASDPRQLKQTPALDMVHQLARQPGVTEVVEQIDWQGQAAIAIARPMPGATAGRDASLSVPLLVAVLHLSPFLGDDADTVMDRSAMALLDVQGAVLLEQGHASQREALQHRVPPGFEGVLLQARGDGGQQLVAYRYFQLNAAQGWSLVHFVDLEDVLSGLWRHVLAVVISGLICSVLGVALIHAAARRVTRPLSRLAQTAQRFGDGELSARASPNAGDTREVAQLRQTFNTMADHIEQVQHSLESMVTQRTAEAHAARDQLLATLDALPDLLFEIDGTTRIVDYHSNRHDLLLVPPQGLIGQRFDDLLPPEALQVCLAAIEEARLTGHSSGAEYCLQLPQGSMWFEASVVRKPHHDAQGGERFIFLSRDITARHEAQDEVRRLAFSDPLTGLANRRLMMDRLDQAAKAAARSGHHCAVMLLDLDHFKDLNDSRGHEVGDRLLQETSRRLLASVREQDTVSRLGGDEFVLVLTQFSPDPITAWTEIAAVAEKVRSRIAQPYELPTSEAEHCLHQLTLSLGVCVFNDHHLAPAELLKRADTAMYRAKASGRNAISFFDQSMATAIQAKLALEEQLREAVLERQFYLCYQPLLNRAGQVLGAEVLVRWQHPRHGTVMPGEFIAAMERTGQIIPFGHWVLDESCRTLKRWAKDPSRAELSLAVNVSARQLHMPDFVSDVLALLRRHAVAPHRLKLELTESVLLEHTDEVIEKMSALRAAGVRFALDDFGTGYSSLSYLKRLPLDLLKIDRTFVREVLDDANDAAIVRLIVGLGRALGIPVLAEGIETQEQLAYLSRSGCRLFQGTFLGSPMRLPEFEAALAHPAKTAGQRGTVRSAH